MEQANLSEQDELRAALYRKHAREKLGHRMFMILLKSLKQCTCGCFSEDQREELRRLHDERTAILYSEEIPIVFPECEEKNDASI